jgi:hypothetical protein
MGFTIFDNRITNPLTEHVVFSKRKKGNVLTVSTTAAHTTRIVV